MGYETTCHNQDEQKKEGGYWETGIMYPKSHISLRPSCHPLLVGSLSQQGFVNSVGTLVTQLRPYRCNYFVVYLCPEEDQL